MSNRAELLALAGRLTELRVDREDWRVEKTPHDYPDGTKHFNHVRYTSHIGKDRTPITVEVAQYVTPELGELLCLLHNNLDGIVSALRAASAPAAGVDDPTSDEHRIDALRLKAFRTNDPDDRQAYFNAASKWFQDRHYRRLAASAHVAGGGERERLANEIDAAFERSLYASKSNQAAADESLREVLWDNKSGIIAYLRTPPAAGGGDALEKIEVLKREISDWKQEVVKAENRARTAEALVATPPSDASGAVREALDRADGDLLSIQMHELRDHEDYDVVQDLAREARKRTQAALSALPSQADAGKHIPTSDSDVHPDVAEALTQAFEYFEGLSDVNDGDYCIPEPNAEMRLAQMCKDALDRLLSLSASPPEMVQSSDGGEPMPERTRARLAGSDEGLGPMQAVPRAPGIKPGPSDDLQKEDATRIEGSMQSEGAVSKSGGDA